MANSDGFAEEFADDIVTGDLSSILACVDEMGRLEQAIEATESMLKEQKSNLHLLRTVTLVELMDEANVSQLSMDDGTQIAVGDIVSGSLPKDAAKLSRAIRWLEEHEGGSLIKSQLTVDFSREQRDEAVDMLNTIEHQGYVPNLKSGVHPQTLQAYVRERLANGDEVDTETLGVYVGRIVKAKRGKK